MIPFEGKLVYLRRPNTGSGGRTSSLHYFDLKEREEKEVMGSVSRATATADGKQLLVSSGGKYGIIKVAPKNTPENIIRNMPSLICQFFFIVFPDAHNLHSRDFLQSP